MLLILKSQQGLHIKNHTQTTKELPSPLQQISGVQASLLLQML